MAQPAICRIPLKLVCTSTPTVYPPKLGGKILEEVPIPPLYPKQIVPVPAPTAPSSTSPEDAVFIAFITFFQ